LTFQRGDPGKAEMFDKVLKNIFSEDHNNDFDMEHYSILEDYITTNRENLFISSPDKAKHHQDFREEEVKEVAQVQIGPRNRWNK
jgi:hypothetical protein